MTKIEASIQINAPIDKVWQIVSDLDNEPKFWKGTKSIRNISKQENEIIREVTIAFKDKKCMQKITIEPNTRIYILFTEGIINGSKTITLSKINDDTKTNLVTVWDIKLAGMMSMFTGMLKKHIKKGTDQALASIKDQVEK